MRKRKSKYQKRKEEAVREVAEKNEGKVKVWINRRTFVLCHPNEVSAVKDKYRVHGKDARKIDSVRNTNPVCL